MLLNPNSRLLFIGDSITDCGRKRPIGEGAFDRALGNGYVSIVDAALTAAYPDYAIGVVNMGISGNTIRDLKARWQTDVLAFQPDWLVILIGINDVWQQFSRPRQTQQHISAQQYAQIMNELIQQIKPTIQGIILMTPYFLEPNRRDPMREMMDHYGALVGEAASRHGAILVDTQAAFNSLFAHMHPMSLSVDRIHLNLSGHMVLARELLNSIEYQWNRSAENWLENAG